MQNQIPQLVPRPGDAKGAQLENDLPASSAAPVRGASPGIDESNDDVPRLGNILVGLLVIVIAAVLVVMAIRFEHL